MPNAADDWSRWEAEQRAAVELEDEVSNSDGRVKAMRALFELLSKFVLIGLLAIFAGYTLNDLLISSLFGKWRAGLVFLSMLLTAIALNVYFERSFPARLHCRAMAFPIMITAGVLGGWYWGQNDFLASDKGQAWKAAASACLQVPSCIPLASRYNNGLDIRDVLPEQVRKSPATAATQATP